MWFIVKAVHGQEVWLVVEVVYEKEVCNTCHNHVLNQTFRERPLSFKYYAAAWYPWHQDSVLTQRD